MKVIATMLLTGVLAGCGAMADQPMGMAGGSRSMMQGSSMMQGGMCSMGPQAAGMGGMSRMCPMAAGMQGMDMNRDGMVSRDEYLAAHAAMFDAMKKNERGQGARADLGMCPMMSGVHRQ